MVNFPVKGNIFKILASDESWWLIIPTLRNGLKKKISKILIETLSLGS